MPKFLLVDHGGGVPETPDASEKAMPAWGAWSDDLGAATVDPGAPVCPSQTVKAAGHFMNSSANPVSGYGIVTRRSYEQDWGFAAGNPMVFAGPGFFEVADMIDM